MPHFVPDAESITEFYGEYEQFGCKFEVVPVPEMGGYGPRMELGANSEVSPAFPLLAAKMDSPEAAAQWMARLRDHERSLFFSLLKQGQSEVSFRNKPRPALGRSGLWQHTESVRATP